MELEQPQQPYVRTQFGEKFWAFVILISAVLAVVITAQVWPPDKDSVVRIMDAAVGGLLLALGAAANALFRVSQKDTEEAVTARLTAETNQKLTDKVAPLGPQDVNVVNPPHDPANVQEAGDGADTQNQPLPPMFREEPK